MFKKCSAVPLVGGERVALEGVGADLRYVRCVRRCRAVAAAASSAPAHYGVHVQAHVARLVLDVGARATKLRKKPPTRFFFFKLKSIFAFINFHHIFIYTCRLKV